MYKRLWLISPGQILSTPLPSSVQHLCFTAVVSGSCCWHFLVIWLWSRVLDSQDSISWSERREKQGGCLSSWKCFPYVDMFSVTLFCVMKTELNMTLLVVQTILPAMSHLCQVHTINTKTHCNLALSVALMFQFGVQDTSQTHHPLPGRNLNFSSLLCFSFSPSLQLPSLSLVSSFWEAGSVITRGLRASWLPFIESSQQIVFYETALSSQPARTCPGAIKDHTVSRRSRVHVCPTGFRTIPPLLTHISVHIPQQQVEKTTQITWANMLTA